MLNITATNAVNDFHKLLNLVEHGETVRITKHGKCKARMVPDCDFISSREFAGIFAGHKATAQDRAAADAIARNIEVLDMEETHALAH